MNSISVKLSGLQVRDINMPHQIRLLIDGNAGDFLAWIFIKEEREFHSRRVLAEKRKIDSVAIPSGTQRIWLAAPQVEGDRLTRRCGGLLPMIYVLAHPILSLPSNLS